MKNSFLAFFVSAFLSTLSYSQSISLPPNGDNQKCSITQWIGLAYVNITYNSPDVTGPNGKDRKGKIWGGVVPFGLSDNNFGTARKMPWRAGANENTVITFSHDMKVDGKSIKAGSYGLHMIPGKEKWTIIFNENTTAWGSYFYDESKDALRINVIPSKSEYTEWLTYDFIEKKPTFAVACLKWEELKVPFRIEADVVELYLSKIRQELQNSNGFSWQSWVAAVNFCIQNNTNLPEAKLWAQYAIEAPFVGERNFTTLSTKATLLLHTDEADLASQVFEEAINEPTATISNIHNLGRSLIGMGYAEKAMELFEQNRNKHPDDNFITFVGLARGYEATGKTKQAMKHFRLAAENAPEGQKEYYLNLANSLE